MAKILVVYYKEELPKNKQPNIEKVVLTLEKSLVDRNNLVTKLSLEGKTKLKLKEQFKKEKELELGIALPDLSVFDAIVIGSPILGSLTSSPLVNVFIRSITESSQKNKFFLFVTGIVPGFGIKKMQNLLLMHNIKPTESTSFTSIFDFDSKKLEEVKKFAELINERIHVD